MAALPLRTVLEEISAAGLPTAEQRRLRAYAVRHALELPPQTVESEPLESLESALCCVASAFEVDKPSVQSAKQMMRARGEPGRRLAARLGRLSKARNYAAHPDSRLEADIAALASCKLYGQGGTTSCSTPRSPTCRTPSPWASPRTACTDSDGPPGQCCSPARCVPARALLSAWRAGGGAGSGAGHAGRTL